MRIKEFRWFIATRINLNGRSLGLHESNQLQILGKQAMLVHGVKEQLEGRIINAHSL